jgi:hypothetical protein
VAANGDDNNEGSLTAPFKTINNAINILQPGDQCILREGVYYETIALNTSGTTMQPVTIAAYNGEKVIVSGGQVVEQEWERWSENPSIWRNKINFNPKQLFLDDRSMIEARWPNMKFHENWDASKKWALTDEGSDFGRVICNGVGQLGVNLTGGLVYIKVGKGNDCFSRQIHNHTAGSNQFTWDTNLFEGVEYTGEDGDPVKMARYGHVDNEFFISGNLELLDAETEWFYDESEGWLYFYPPNGINPNHQTIEYKKREHGVTGTNISNVQFYGVKFKGCNIELSMCDNMRFENCQFIYPTYRFIHFNRKDYKEVGFLRGLTIKGNNNKIISCEMAWADLDGMYLWGENNTVYNCVVHDGNLHGKHPGAAITSRGPNSIINNTTVYNCGGVGIYSVNKGAVITDKVHVFNCGIHCVDVSAYYIPWGDLHTGSEIRFSWFHNTHGIGMRCDSYGRDISVHHNVVWECERNCKWEGYNFNIVNNTYVSKDESKSGLMLVLSDLASLDDSEVHNNLTLYKISERSTNGIVAIPDNGTNFTHNQVLDENELDEYFADPSGFDWRSKAGSSIVDAGIIIDDINKYHYHGSMPDIGAYEYNGVYWIPGASWLPGNLQVPTTMGEAQQLAEELKAKWTQEEQIPTGINQEKLAKDTILKLWPNPVGNYLNISCGDTGHSFNFKIIDISGNVLYRSSIEARQSNVFDIGFLEKGIYVVICENNVKQLTAKVIKH